MDAASLKHLDTILARLGTKRTYKAVLSDWIVGEYTLEELLAAPNSKQRAILGITVSVEEPRYGGYVTLDDDWNNVTWILRSAEEEALLAVSAKLKEWLREIRAWYHPITVGLDGWLGLAAIIGMYSLLLFVARFTDVLKINSTVVSVSLGVAVVVVIFVIEPILKRLFPLAVFATGYGVQRNQSLQLWRRTLGVSVLLAIGVRLVYDRLIR